MTNIMTSGMETLYSLFLFRLPLLLLYIVKHCCTLSKIGEVKKRSMRGMRGELASTPSQILGQLEDRGDFPTNDPMSLFLRHRHRHRHRQHGDDDDVIVNGCVLGALPWHPGTMAHCPRPSTLVNDHHHDNNDYHDYYHDLEQKEDVNENGHINKNDFDHQCFVNFWNNHPRLDLKNLNSNLHHHFPGTHIHCILYSVTSSLMCELVVSVLTPDKNLWRQHLIKKTCLPWRRV